MNIIDWEISKKDVIILREGRGKSYQRKFSLLPPGVATFRHDNPSSRICLVTVRKVDA